MADFTLQSRFNKEAAFSSVKFGGDSYVLEVELNEMQEIIKEKIYSAFRNYFLNGIFGSGTMSYNSTTDVFTIENENAIVDGEAIYIKKMILNNVVEGAIIYLEVWNQEANFNSEIKKWGNQQEIETVENVMLDPRVLEETSRRTVLCNTLSLNNSNIGHKYLKLAHIENNTLIIDTISIGKAIYNINGVKSTDGKLTIKASDIKLDNNHNIDEQIQTFDSQFSKVSTLNRKFKPKLGTNPFLTRTSIITNVMTDEEIVDYVTGFADAGLDGIGLLVDIEPYNNLIPKIGIDSGADGISDGWTRFISTGITCTTSVINSEQKIDITNSTAANDVQFYYDLTATPNQKINVEVMARMTGTNVDCRLSVNWYNGATYLSTSVIVNTTSSTNVKLKNFGLIAPANTTKARVLFSFKVLAVGGTGTAYFSKADETYEIMETLPKLKLLADTALSLGLDINCIKFHNLYAKRNILSINKLSWATQHKAHMIEVFNLFSSYNIPTCCVLNEGYEIWDVTECEPYILDFIATAKSYGYKVSMTAGLTDLRYRCPSVFVDQLDTLMFNIYPSITNLDKKATLDDGLAGWQCSKTLDYLLYYKQLYPNKSIIISETGVQSSWQALAYPAQYIWSEPFDTSGEPVTIYLYGMLEYLKDAKIIDEVWWLYDLDFPIVKDMIKKYLGVYK
jgi:hypothetical protein